MLILVMIVFFIIDDGYKLKLKENLVKSQIYQKVFRKKEIFQLNSTDPSLLEFNSLDSIQKVFQKVLIGISNHQSEIYLLSKEIKNLSLPEDQESSFVSKKFPENVRNDLKSGLRGKRLLILIEIAYLYPNNSYLSFISKNLELPNQTTSREIKQLKNMGYIEQDIAVDNLIDNRFKYFKLTTKGLIFLHLLKETLSISIINMKKSQRIIIESE